MMSVGDVNSCKDKFEKAIDDVQPKFQELKSSWEGESYDSLNGKVGGMVGEVKVISGQFGNLATVVQCYDQYKETAKQYQQVKRDIDEIRSKAGQKMTQEEIDSLSMRLVELERTLRALYERLSSIVSQAKLACSAGSSVKVNAVSFKPVHFV